MTTLFNRHINSDLAHTTRAAQRKLKQLEIEKEQRMEEAEALKMTEEQRRILHNSFRSVKVEFSDLDGLSWSKMPQKRGTSPGQTFVVLTNADLACFGPHETIRASVSSRPRPRTSNSSPILSSRPFCLPPSTSNLRHAHSTLSSGETIKAILHNHRATRSRSPVKGLFPEDAYDSDTERTVCGSDSDLDDRSLPKERKTIRISQRNAALRGISSPSAPLLSARSVASKLATAVPPRQPGGGSPATSKAKSEEPAEVLLPRAVAYPAYITYSEPSFVEPDTLSGRQDTLTSKAPLSPTISQPASATKAVYPISTYNGDSMYNII
ncbi:hypothetical protein C0992_006650 [Termitomyces sp. T32_za158]|nr:hypothetical protein C0992_006650 [Termitomyces sp. T32_za158]